MNLSLILERSRGFQVVGSPHCGFGEFMGAVLSYMPRNVFNSQLAAEGLKTRLAYSFTYKQREIKGVIPLHQALAIVVSVKMVADLWLRMSPC